MPLVFDHVSYAYSSHEGEVLALDDVSLTIEDGAFYGIIGHTGSGKSTLLQLMSGLLAPSAGRILLDGEDLSDKRVRQTLFLKVGIAFQRPEHQLFAPTVAEDIGYVLQNAGYATAEVDARIREAMRRMHLDYDHYAQLSPFELSGGEMRRVALAGVIAGEPQLLILDEPAAGLDPAGREKLIRIIEDLHRAGTTVVMVTHSMDEIARLATRLLVLKEGVAVMQGSPVEVFAHADELRAMNLGVPRATAFAAELRACGLPLPEGLLSVEELAEAIAGLADIRAAAAPANTKAEVRRGL